jgi:hypothetical protein
VPISIRKAPSYTALATPEFLALVEAAQPKFTAMQAAAEKQWQIKSWDEWGFQQEAGSSVSRTRMARASARPLR